MDLDFFIDLDERLAPYHIDLDRFVAPPEDEAEALTAAAEARRSAR